MYAIYVIYIYVIYICNIRNIYMQVSSVIFEFQKSMLIKNNFWDFPDSDQIITFYVTEKCLLYLDPCQTSVVNLFALITFLRA